MRPPDQNAGVESSGTRNVLPRAIRRALVAVIVAGLGAGLIGGFLAGSRERALETEREKPVEAPLRVSSVNGEPVVTLDAATRQNSDIQLVRLESAARQQEIQAYATVLDLQPLTELSNSYTTTKARLQIVQAQLNASRLAYERAQKLYQNQQNISAAQFQAAEAAFRVDEANVTGAQVQLQNLAATAVQVWGPVLSRAMVERSPLLLGLLQRQSVLLQVTLPPGEVLAEAPQTAAVLSENGARTIVQHVSPAPRTDSRIQGISYFYSAPPDGALLPGMNVVVLLASGKTTAGALVPGSAIVWWQGRAWAYFRTGEQAFTRREIPTGVPAAGGGYIVSGLPGDMEVVTQGAQMLLSEEFRSQIQVGEE